MKDSRLNVVFADNAGKIYPIDLVANQDIFKGIKKLIDILDETLCGCPRLKHFLFIPFFSRVEKA